MVARIRIEIGNQILRGDSKFDGGRTREDLENEMVDDEDMVEAERQYEKI